MDVVVVGGGVAGVAAAVSAAQAKAKVTLIERYGFLGGLATTDWVGPILGHTIPSEKTPAIRGFLELLAGKLHAMGGGHPWEECNRRNCVEFNSEILKIVLDDLMEEYGITLLLHTLCIGAVAEKGRLAAVELQTRNGRETIPARAFIDCTGDGDLVFLSGAGYRIGRVPDGKVMAMGSLFRITGVAPEWEKDKEKIAAAITQERLAKGLACYHSGFRGGGSVLGTLDFCPNMTRVGGDPTDVRDLTAGEIALRKAAWRVFEICRANSPAFKDASVIFPTQIGIREARRMEGLAELTEEDVLTGRKHADAVARSTYWIDIHCPLGRTKDGVHLCKRDCPSTEPCVMLRKHRHLLPTNLRPPAGDYHTIPYGALVSKTWPNLLAAGRCISADIYAIAAVRVMAPCIAMGQAAGIAAAIAAREKVEPAALDVTAVQKEIAAQGGLC